MSVSQANGDTIGDDGEPMAALLTSDEKRRNSDLDSNDESDWSAATMRGR